MPIMAVQDQNDVRGSARVLASAAMRYIDNPPVDNRHVPAMNGVFRLLKAYRVSKLEGYEYQPSIDRGPDAVSLLPSASLHVAELRDALRSALDEAGGSRGPDETLADLEEVIRQAARNCLDDGERRQVAVRFLEALLRRLHAAA